MPTAENLFPKQDENDDILTDVVIRPTHGDWQSAISELSLEAAAGPDGFPAILLKKVCGRTYPSLGHYLSKVA